MSAISPLFISERITQPLRLVSQRRWTLIAACGVLKTLVVSLTVVLAASLLLGFVTSMPIPIRIVIAALTWGTVIWWTIRSLAPALARWSLSQSALRVDSLLPDSQERISSAVELSQSEDQFRGSPDLLNHLVKQAEGDAERVNAAAVVPFQTMFHWALGLLPVLALWAFFTLNPHTAVAVFRGLFTALTPWKIPPAMLADFAVQPGDKTIDQGDPLTISVTLSATEKKALHATLVREFGTGQSVTQAMAQISGSQFNLPLDPPAIGFKYHVSTDRGDSPSYTVTVNPRPSITQIDARYDFPKYTALETKNYIGSDGSIDAVIGTQITLTIHTTTTLVADKSSIVFDDGKATRATVPLGATAEANVYTATFPVTRTCDYQINLLNNYNLANKDNDPHGIVAELDLPPSIAILTPKDKISVSPDDDVTVTYHAADDYGVAKVEALVQVDDRPERVVPVMIHAAEHRSFNDKWTLSVPKILQQDGVTEASHIGYQLRVTDNRYPDPQFDVSARQILTINKYEQKTFQEKVNEQRKDDLNAAIRKAIQRLYDLQGPLTSLKDPSARLQGPDMVRQTEQAKDKLGKTSKDLSASASQFLDTPFADVARAARDIADGDIAHAADDTARLGLDAADAGAARADGDKAFHEAVTAREALEKLLQKVEEAERKAAAAEELKQAARKQEAVAKAMEEHPEKKDENNQKQNDAINKLNEAVQKDPSFQNPEAKKLAADVADLEKKIEKEQEKQTELQNQTAKQEEKTQAQDQANAVAEEQKKLNADVQQFAKDDKQPIDQSHAQVPDKNQEDNVVKHIEDHQVQQAAQEAQQQANQLKQDAHQLKDQANNPNNPTPDQQKQQQQDQQNQQDAQNAANQANAAAQDLKNQENQDKPNPDQAKTAADQVAKAADAIQKQADKIEAQNAQNAQAANHDEVKKDADAAKADAQQAAQDAQAAAAAQDPADAKHDADKAQQELAKAGQEVADAAKAEAQADKADAQQQNQQAAAKAGDQAQALADQQQAIADKLDAQAKQQADAQAAQPADQTAKAQAAAADQSQQASHDAQALADQAKNSPDPAVAQRAADAAKALDQAAADQQAAAKAEADNKPAEAAQAQADAQQALAKAEDALRGNPEQAQANADQGKADPAQGQPDAGKPDAGPPDAGKPDAGQGTPEAGKPDAGQGPPDAGQGKPEAGQGQADAGQPPQSAPQAAAEAAQAQQQALSANPAAAAEAAQALAQAAQAAAAALPGQGPPGTEPGTEPGSEPGHEAEAAPDKVPFRPTGIKGQATGGDNKVPAVVAALGVNPSDWAKLPPMMQKELMNAAQHGGPPAYKANIKNYYIRIARAQSEQPETPADKQ